MSIFDIIKYKHIDITNSDVLIGLPEKLVTAYWDSLATDLIQTFGITYNKKCILLANWASHDLNIYRRKYEKALKEYSYDNI